MKNYFKEYIEETKSVLKDIYKKPSGSGDDNKNYIKDWATSQGLTYKPYLTDNSHVPPLTIASQDFDTNHEITGEVNGHPFVLFRLTSITHTRNGNFFSYKWVVNFTLERELPGFIIDGKNGNKIARGFKEFEKIKLEGSFPSKFDVFAPKGDHIEVLSVMSPDVMWTLYEKHPHTDVIVAGKRVWILMGDGNGIAWYDESSDPVLKMNLMLDAAYDMSVELGHRSKTYK